MISINNFQNCKKSILYFKENWKTINNNHQIRALAVHKTDIKPIQSRDNVIIDGRKSQSHCVVTRFIEFIDVDLIAWQLLNDYWTRAPPSRCRYCSYSLSRNERAATSDTHPRRPAITDSYLPALQIHSIPHPKFVLTSFHYKGNLFWPNNWKNMTNFDKIVVF